MRSSEQTHHAGVPVGHLSERHHPHTPVRALLQLGQFAVRVFLSCRGEDQRVLVTLERLSDEAQAQPAARALPPLSVRDRGQVPARTVIRIVDIGLRVLPRSFTFIRALDL